LSQRHLLSQRTILSGGNASFGPSLTTLRNFSLARDNLDITVPTGIDSTTAISS